LIARAIVNAPTYHRVPHKDPYETRRGSLFVSVMSAALNVPMIIWSARAKRAIKVVTGVLLVAARVEPQWPTAVWDSIYEFLRKA